MNAVLLGVAVGLTAACSGTPAPPASTSADAPDPARVGTIRGRVVLDGHPPAAAVIRLDGDPKCVTLAAGEERRSEEVVVGNDNGLQHVFVYIKEGLPARLYPVPAQPVVLDQQKCRYVPRVIGAQVGQQVLLRNSDPLSHNIRTESAVNEPFDVGTPVQGMEVPKTFATREVMVPVKCNVHSWMRAYVGVVEHPFFDVSEGDGTYVLANIPPGTYTLEAWHERLGTQTQQVSITGGDSHEVAFTFALR